MKQKDGWKKFEEGIDKFKSILEGQSDQFRSGQYTTLYTAIYNMCVNDRSKDKVVSRYLYDLYRKILEEYMIDVVFPSLSEKHDEFLLREFMLRWGNHNLMVRWLCRFFDYLHRYFVPKRSLPTLNEIGNEFRVLIYTEFNVKVKDAVLVLIEKERDGEQIDRALVRDILGIFVEIGMGSMDRYVNDFENHMLEATADYHFLKAFTWTIEDSCATYMIKAEECLKKEKERVANYLHASSEEKLLKISENELLIMIGMPLLEKKNSEYVSLKDDDFARMYRLYRRVPMGLDLVSDMFKKHVTNEGMALLTEAEGAASNKKADKKDVVGMHEHTFVKNVIQLHDKYLQYVGVCFGNHTLFHKVLKEAFEVICNKDVAGSSSAEVLAASCDILLKKGGNKEVSDEAMEETFEKVVKLLAYVSDKDLFAEFCRKKLARRLLFNRSASDEYERSILSKLKQQCGGQFTSKMEGMVSDMALVKQKQNEFGEYVKGRPQASFGIDFSVTVLTTGVWPSYKPSDLYLPAEMAKCVETFKQYYDTKNKKKRKLTWIYSLGSCNLSGKFDQRPIELIVTTYQASLLLLFNDAEKLSFTEIRDQLNLTDDDVIRLLHSLSCSKYKILNKDPNTKTISQKDMFSFNNKFTDKMHRIKIPFHPVDEKKKVIEAVDKDRKYAIDATIVRIMKSRKNLGHQQLVMECVEQLKSFKPDKDVIKKRIEDLIGREFLERDAANPQMYRYLA